MERLKKFFFIRGAFDIWTLLAKASGLASVLGFIFIIFPNFIKSNEALFGLIFIGVLSIYILIDNVLYRIKMYRYEKEIVNLQKQVNYSKAFPLLNSGFATIHDLIRKYNCNFQSINFSEKLHAFQHLCDKLSNVFKDLTGKQCNVCIKIFEKEKNTPLKYSDNKLLKVTTLCRDTENHTSREFSQKIESYLAWNTDFIQIFENIGSREGEKFFNNALPLFREYWNTSFPIYDKSTTYKGLSNNLSDNDRVKYWPLPYKSTIVVPICPHSGSISSLDEVIGFLCVDSPEMNAFDIDYQYSILTGVADGIYFPLSCWMSMGFK